jgi:hypothetical protein
VTKIPYNDLKAGVLVWVLPNHDSDRARFMYRSTSTSVEGSPPMRIRASTACRVIENKVFLLVEYGIILSRVLGDKSVYWIFTKDLVLYNPE